MSKTANNWQPIDSTTPTFERVIVAGWEPPKDRVIGYWWWNEDVVVDGAAFENPRATIWCPINLPPFPDPPTD